MPHCQVNSKLSLKAITAGATALLVLMTTLVGILRNSQEVSTWFRDIFPKDPYIVEVTYPSVVPIYLKYYYDAEGLGQQESLYWFRIKAHNNTRASLFLEVSFVLHPGDCNFVVLKNKESYKYSLGGNETKEETISPPLEFTKRDFAGSCSLQINWLVENDRKEIKYTKADLAPITLLPIHTVKWDLLNPAKKPVSREFLLSSLVAWSLSRDGLLLKRVEQLKQKTHASSPAKWLTACYDDLFREPNALSIHSTASTYPFSGEKIVALPGEILSDGQAEPLEAGLLMAAMVRAELPTRRTRLTLFILPRADDLPRPSVLLAWSLPDSREWEAIDLTEPKKLDLKSNIEQSQKLLQQTLSQEPQLMASLSLKGVFVGDQASSPMAVSLDRAEEQFRIRPLD